jgi:osmotically-inducible protein OsmY
MNQNYGRQDDEPRHGRYESRNWEDETGGDRDFEASRSQRSRGSEGDERSRQDFGSGREMRDREMRDDDREQNGWTRSGRGAQSSGWGAGEDDRYRRGQSGNQRSYERDYGRRSGFDNPDRAERSGYRSGGDSGYGFGGGRPGEDDGSSFGQSGSGFGQSREDRFGGQGTGQRTGTFGNASAGSSYGQAGSGQSYGRSSAYGQSPAWSGQSGDDEMSGSAMRSRGHTGKGPKGYQRSDERIREDVSERMTEDEQLDASEITVQVNKGEVILSGTVSDREQKRHAETLAERVSGVKDVTNNIKVQQQSTRSDGARSGSEQGTGNTSATAASPSSGTSATTGSGGKGQGRSNAADNS